MTTATPDADALREGLSRDARDRVAQLEVFAEIDSTNSYLMRRAGPAPGRARIATTRNQTAGRGQRGRSWISPPDSGIALSIAYTYKSQPENLSALTLAIGLSAISVLADLGIGGIQLKWPNDLAANSGKLGGILTEAQQQSTGAVTVVTGIGINIRMPDAFPTGEGSHWASHVADLASLCDEPPDHSVLLVALIEGLIATFVNFEAVGFAPYQQRWRSSDWLFGRQIVVDAGGEKIEGLGAGVAEDGSLLVATDSMGTRLVMSGTILRAGKRGLDA